jgi:MYND finger
MVFSNSIRHDRNTGSILMEAYVVCLNPSRVQELTSALRIVPQEEILSIRVSDKESLLWKQLMPCLVERCRQTWTHQPSCEYRTTNRIPLSTTHGEVPNCSCGEGKALDGFPAGAQYKAFAKFATQIAIAPIFAVHYVEPLVLETTSVLPDAIIAGPRTLRQGQGTQMLNSLSVAGSAAAATATMAKCDNCGAEKQGLKPCAQCGTARYCNHACQKAAWKQHKKVCKK